MTMLQPMTIASLLVTGMGVAILGSVKVRLAQRLEIDEARVGGMVSVFGFIMSPVIFAAGFLTDLVGKQAVLLGGSIAMTLSLALLAQSRRYWIGFVAVIFSSAGWSAMVNVNNALIPLAFTGSMAYANNLANVFFGMGAFLTPMGVAFLLRRASFSTAMHTLAGLAAVPAALALGVDFSSLISAVDPGPADVAASSAFGTLLGDPVMWLCGFTLFFYAPLEACTGAWTTTYLADKKIAEGTASNLLSAFWLSFMLARLLTAFTLPSGKETLLICVMSVLCVGVLSGIVLSRSGTPACVLVVAAGFIYGPIFPTLMAVLLQHFPANFHGRAVGLLFGIGGIGWTVTPMLIGAYAGRTSIQRGFSIAVASAVGLSVVALILAAAN
jgi:fucose permease